MTRLRRKRLRPYHRTIPTGSISSHAARQAKFTKPDSSRQNMATNSTNIVGTWLHIPTKQQRGQAVNLYRGDYSAVTIKKVLQHRGNDQLATDKNMVDHIILLIEDKQDIIVERGLCYRGNTLWIHKEEKNTLPRGRHLICLCNVEDTPLREDMTWTDIVRTEILLLDAIAIKIHS